MRRFAVVLSLLFAIVAVVPAAVAGGGGHAGGGGGCHTGRQETSGTTVDMADYCFKQTVLHVSSGQSVTWTNHDDALHSVTGVGGEWGDYEPINPGATVTSRFDAAGVYPYFCILHPGMVGAVVVDGDIALQQAAAVRDAPGGEGGGSSAIAWWFGGGITLLALLLGAVYVATRRSAEITKAAA